MNYDEWPTDPRAATALVALVVADMVERDYDDLNALMHDLMRTAWPSPRSQRQ
jgi:hypothetical protein